MSEETGAKQQPEQKLTESDATQTPGETLSEKDLAQTVGGGSASLGFKFTSAGLDKSKTQTF